MSRFKKVTSISLPAQAQRLQSIFKMCIIFLPVIVFLCCVTTLYQRHSSVMERWLCTESRKYCGGAAVDKIKTNLSTIITGRDSKSAHYKHKAAVSTTTEEFLLFILPVPFGIQNDCAKAETKFHRYKGVLSMKNQHCTHSALDFILEWLKISQKMVTNPLYLLSRRG